MRVEAKEEVGKGMCGLSDLLQLQSSSEVATQSRYPAPTWWLFCRLWRRDENGGLDTGHGREDRRDYIVYQHRWEDNRRESPLSFCCFATTRICAARCVRDKVGVQSSPVLSGLCQR